MLAKISLIPTKGGLFMDKNNNKSNRTEFSEEQNTNTEKNKKNKQ